MEKNKHILVLNRSFWPDVESTGQLLTEFCEELAKKYRVTVIAGRSYYTEKGKPFNRGAFYSKERYKGIEIIRVRHTKFWKGNLIARIVNWLTYSMLSFVAAINMKPNLIVACTDPPFLGIVSLIIKKLRSVPFIYNCTELYLDFALESGRLKKGFLSHIFDALDRKAFCVADLVVPLGQSMANRIKNKGVSEERIKVISDWVDTAAIKSVPKENNPLLKKYGLENKFIIMYSGNIGLGQDFDSILKAASIIKSDSSWHLVFIGDGVRKNEIIKDAQNLGLKNALFLPYQPKEMLSFSLSMADLHLVPLKKGLTGTIVPSKIYGIMAAGRPYLAITDKECEAAQTIERFGCGLWVNPGDVYKIAEKIEWALKNKEELERMGKKGRDAAEREFDKSIMISEWLKVLEGYAI